jgi:alginate O-acetyltransferase complex protein AlgI
MLFTQPLFLVFFAAVFGLAWSTRDDRRRKLVLLAASYLFYAAWDWRFLSLILASTAVDFAAALTMERTPSSSARKGWLIASLTVNLGMLAAFKYFNFFVESAALLLRPFGAEIGDRALAIVLPVGISFFTFQTMSYTIDVYRGKLVPLTSFADFALFVSFFPQLVAGPIVRAAHFLPQLARRPRWAAIDKRRYLALFLAGFVKKACVADAVAPYVDRVFARPELYAAAAVWIAVLLYAVQIYCDFSGYTDMAIACAGLLGYDLGPNFNFPYLASSLTDFWRRWHISLSSWLRDYLFIPLGGSRGTRLFTYRNLLLTMLLGGLWHGAAWTFVAWGALHGLGLVAHKEWIRRTGRTGRTGQTCRTLRILGTAATFYAVCCAWIFFRAQSFGDAAVLLKAFVLFDAAGTLALEPWLLALFAALAAVHALASRMPLERLVAAVPDGLFAPAYGVATALALAFVPMRAAPFIYFQF